MAATRKTKKIESMRSEGRRWRKPVVGGIYFTSRIYVSGRLVHTTPYDYGYGDQYIVSAYDWLAKHDYIHPRHKDEPLWSIAKREGFNVASDVRDVRRKKDL